MSKIEGIMTCDAQLIEQQDKTVSLVADGLKMLWDTDITGCPRHITFADDLRAAKYNVEHKMVDESAVDYKLLESFGIKDIHSLLKWLEDNIPGYDPVLSHGDYCMPNILVQDSKITGFIDLGETAVSDKYKDIAMCCISLKNNYGGVFGGKVYADFNPMILFDKLGIKPDLNKLNWYILLNELFKT